MNYTEHDKFPNHDAVDCPCVVYIKVVDEYYYFSVCNAGMPQRELIPKELGEYFRDQEEGLPLTSLGEEWTVNIPPLSDDWYKLDNGDRVRPLGF